MTAVKQCCGLAKARQGCKVNLQLCFDSAIRDQGLAERGGEGDGIQGERVAGWGVEGGAPPGGAKWITGGIERRGLEGGGRDPQEGQVTGQPLSPFPSLSFSLPLDHRAAPRRAARQGRRAVAVGRSPGNHPSSANPITSAL